MANVPPPPDELPEGFWNEKDPENQTAELIASQYKLLTEATKEFQEIHKLVLYQRKLLHDELKRVENYVSAAPRYVLLGGGGALFGMGLYDLLGWLLD